MVGDLGLKSRDFFSHHGDTKGMEVHGGRRAVSKLIPLDEEIHSFAQMLI
jgi:hypothetical protein